MADNLTNQNFVSSTTLKNYATATASLTVVINIILYCYTIFKHTIMPNTFLVPTAICLSILYILTFFKRENNSTYAQYAWVTCLNSLMLFTSISGTNGMLDTARKNFDNHNVNHNTVQKNYADPNMQEASIGDFFKHILFPTHGWFNTAEAEKNDTKIIIQSAINNIDTTQKVIDTLISQKTKDLTTINELHEQLDSIRTNYITTLSLYKEAESNIASFKNLLDQQNIAHEAVPPSSAVSPAITANIIVLQQQQQQQEQQKKQQQNIQIHQINKLQQQNQQLQMQRRKLQTQQEQQIQY